MVSGEDDGTASENSYLAIRILLSYLDSPRGRTIPTIQDVLHLGHRGKNEFAIEHEAEHAVLSFQSFDLSLFYRQYNRL
jgi:hypothetical protein